MEQFHYFATTCFAWATASTLAEALAKVAKASDVTKKGLYVCTYKVHAPKEATYKINFYMPQGVKLSERREFTLVNTKGHVIPLEPKE